MDSDIRSNMQGNTHQAILDTAIGLVQRCGYNAFSYADVSELVGIRKASIHYYFPAKSDLVRSVVAHYRAIGRIVLAQWSELDALQQLQRFIDLYSEDVEGVPRMCLCALLGAEMPTLPDDVRAEVQGYYQDQEQWLSQLLQKGIREGQLRVSGPIEAAARAFRAGFEGAMISARVYNDPARFRLVAEALIQPYLIRPA